MKIFHHNDADGRSAAAIVLMAARYMTYAHELVDGPLECIEMDYAKPIPHDSIKENEMIVIVDFSFKPGDMALVLAKTKDVTWIDHHATAAVYDYGCTLKGLRDFTNKGMCGAELTWKFYFPNLPMPEALTLLGDYDAWRMKLKPKCLEFYEGLKLRDTRPESELWLTLSADYMGGCEGQQAGITIDDISKGGAAAIKYRDMYCAEMRHAFGYACTLVGADGLKCYALNCYRFGSQAYGPLVSQYDILIAYVSDGCNTTVSLYSEKPEVHVGQIAKLHGGGGHCGAAGFVVKEGQALPFRRITK